VSFPESFFKDPKRVPEPRTDGESPEDEEAAVERELADFFGAACADGVDADEMPGGTGEFGLDPDNPVPCHTVAGAYEYLGCLRTADGAPIQFDRIGSFDSSCSPMFVDGFSISDEDGRKLATIFISPYQRRNSGKAPKGFLLVASPR